MPGWERKFLDWLQAHTVWVAAAVAAALGMYARFALRTFISTDFEVFLAPWYRDITAAGGLGAISQQIGNYNIPYQVLISLMTYLPLPAVYAYKLLSICFDVLLALAVGVLTWGLAPAGDAQRRLWYGVLAGAAAWCSPPVVLNSAAWAQCDSIYSFFAVAALAVLLLRDEPLPALALLGAAFAFKLQAIFLLPFFLIVWFAKRRFSVLSFAAIPAMMLLLSLPGLLAGRSWTDVFGLYVQQTETYPDLTLNYPSLWALFGNFRDEWRDFGTLFHPMAIAVCLLVLGVAACLLAGQPAWQSAHGMLYTAFLTCYTCVLLMPAMHERYGYLYEVLSIAAALLWPRTAKYALALLGITLVTYGGFLQSGWPGLYAIDLQFLAVANTAVWVCYVRDYLRRLRGGFAPEDPLPPAAEKT